jgi:hypothetical protein
MANDFYTQMLADLPSQFKNKTRIEGLNYALARQLNGVRDMFTQLNDLRSLQTAIGKQLDGIGDIAVLSRDEATVLALKSAEFTQMTDDIYRLYLVQKIMANMTNCTYQDIYDAMKILWGRTPIWYSESLDEPATITMTVPALSSFDETSTFLGLWEIRPAGVQLHFTATASEQVGINADFQKSAFIITHVKTGTKPRWAIILNMDGMVIDEELSRQPFTVQHEATRESLHTGTNPVQILQLDIDGVSVAADAAVVAYMQTFDRAGQNPDEAVIIGSQGVVVDGKGQASRFIVDPPQTSEELHSGTRPAQVLTLDPMSAQTYQTLKQEVYNVEFQRTGTAPQPSVVGETDTAGVATGIAPASFSVKYRKCGTGVTKSK